MNHAKRLDIPHMGLEHAPEKKGDVVGTAQQSLLGRLRSALTWKKPDVKATPQPKKETVEIPGFGTFVGTEVLDTHGNAMHTDVEIHFGDVHGKLKMDRFDYDAFKKGMNNMRRMAEITRFYEEQEAQVRATHRGRGMKLEDELKKVWPKDVLSLGSECRERTTILMRSLRAATQHGSAESVVSADWGQTAGQNSELLMNLRQNLEFWTDDRSFAKLKDWEMATSGLTPVDDNTRKAAILRAQYEKRQQGKRAS